MKKYSRISLLKIQKAKGDAWSRNWFFKYRDQKGRHYVSVQSRYDNFADHEEFMDQYFPFAVVTSSSRNLGTKTNFRLNP